MDSRSDYLDRLQRQREQSGVDPELVRRERRELEEATGGRGNGNQGASDPE